MGLGKEAFIVELVIRLIWAKALEYDLGFSDSIKLDEIGLKYNKEGQIKLEFNIHRKTKWKALKNLEKNGYLKREGHKWRMSDRLWNDMKKEIARFKLAEKKTLPEESPQEENENV